MKVGDLVRIKNVAVAQVGIVAAEPRHGINRSWVEVFIHGYVVTFDLRVVRLIQ